MKSESKKQVFDYNLIAAAYHESGHIIVAVLNYFLVSQANVMTDLGNDSNVLFYIYGLNSQIEDDELRNSLLISELQVMYAGLISEKIYYKDICGSSKFPMHLRDGSSYDTSSASSIIRKNKLISPGKKTSMFKRQIRLDVELLLIEHWDAVKAISHALYKKKRLSFDELKYILIRRTNHNDFWKDKFRKIKIIHGSKIPSEEYVKELIT